MKTTFSLVIIVSGVLKIRHHLALFENGMYTFWTPCLPIIEGARTNIFAAECRARRWLCNGQWRPGGRCWDQVHGSPWLTIAAVVSVPRSGVRPHCHLSRPWAGRHTNLLHWAYKLGNNNGDLVTCIGEAFNKKKTFSYWHSSISGRGEGSGASFVNKKNHS